MSALLSITAACEKSPAWRCPSGHQVEVSGQTTSCVDRRGRYDGPSWGAVERGGQVVRFRGQFLAEVPAGRWICERPGERLVIEYKPEAWAKELWGVTEPIAGIQDRRHLAPAPANLCPDLDWSALANNGLEVPQLGSLEARGVAEVIEYAKK